MSSRSIVPSYLKSLEPDQLIELACELRSEIIATVSKTGGHLASSLGVVEIAIALHKVFDTPHDKIVWDVGHQCYPHKLLTGRWDKFHTIRQFGGIAGFPKAAESEYDCFDTGHSGTSISAALGMAIQRDLAGQSHRVVAVIGDGSLTNGMALEAMNHAGFAGADIIVVLNDNEKSISKNVGAYSRYLSRLRTELLYKTSRTRLSNGILSQLRERTRHILTPSRTGAVFEELGFKYLGPVDGHDIAMLCEVFESAKSLKGPVLIHAATSKGKGYRFAEEDPTGFHGVGAFDQVNGKVELVSEVSPTYTSVFGKTIVELAEKYSDIVAITAAMTDGTGLSLFRNRFPSRFFDVGIAEEHAVTLAAGLAKGGAKPFVAIYSTFLQRAYDQVLHDVCLQSLPVRFVLDRSGIVGEDGPTHQGIFDLSYLRTIPHMVIMAPKDENELQHMLQTACDYNTGPMALRFPRGKGEGVSLDNELKALKMPSWEIVRQGSDLAVLASGSMVGVGMAAANLLASQGINIAVVNARFVKPLDENLLKVLCRHYEAIVTVEENSLTGGFGSAVLEFLSENGIANVRLKRIGLPDCFVEHGSQKLLRDRYGLSPEHVVETVKQELRKITN
jgi:1-deoxy-D-xylulose-5-phosphate synthase